MDEHLVINNLDGRYNRSMSPEQNELTKLLGGCYQESRHVLVQSSGLNAISTLLMGCRNTMGLNTTIVYGDEMYCDTPRILQALRDTVWTCLKLVCVNMTDVDSVFNACTQSSATILLFESATNPSGMVFDFSLLDRIRKRRGDRCGLFVSICDNTWLTHLVLNPFSHGVDFVVSSLSKYYSAGTAIGGAIWARDDATVAKGVFEAAERWSLCMGFHVSPHNCELAASAFPEMSERMTRSSAATRALCHALASDPLVLNLQWPLLPSHATFALAQRYFLHPDTALGPSVFTMTVKSKSKTAALNVLKQSKSIDHRTSFGGARIRTDPWPTFQDGNITIRVALGYDDSSSVEKLLSWLQDIIERCTKTCPK